MKKTNKIKNYSLKAARIGKKKKVKGFTLVELIVVIAIIGVLAIVLIPNMLNYVKKARLTTANDAASKIGEQANLIAAEMEMDGKTLTGTYSADFTLSGDAETKDLFATKLSDAVPDLKKGSPKVTITFDSTGQVSNVVYRESATAAYIGAYPTAVTIEEIKSADTAAKLNALYNKKAGVTENKGGEGSSESSSENP